MDEYQKLKDFSLIQGEYKIITINPISSTGEVKNISSFTPTLKVYPYGDRSEEVLSINGVKSDEYSCSFTMPSPETSKWSGKLEYIISLSYSNGDALKGIGHIVII